MHEKPSASCWLLVAAIPVALKMNDDIEPDTRFFGTPKAYGAKPPRARFCDISENRKFFGYTSTSREQKTLVDPTRMGRGGAWDDSEEEEDEWGTNSTPH